MKKILVAVDGSDHASSALSVAAALAAQHDAQMLVVHVVTNEQASEADLRALEMEYANEFAERTQSIFGDAAMTAGSRYTSTMLSNHAAANHVANSIMGEKILSKAVSFLNRHGVENVTTLMTEGQPADKLVELSREHGVDTVIMGCRGVSSLKGLLLGSVSQSVAHRVEASVIIVK